MEVSFVSYCNLVRLCGGTLLGDLLVIPGTMLSVLPEVREHGQGSLCILYTDQLVVRHLRGLDWSLDHCTFYHIESLVHCVRAYDHDVWTRLNAGSPPACPVASSPPKTLQSWCGHPHPVVDPCSCHGHPISVAPKRPAGTGENLAMKKTGQWRARTPGLEINHLLSHPGQL